MMTLYKVRTRDGKRIIRREWQGDEGQILFHEFSFGEELKPETLRAIAYNLNTALGIANRTTEAR
jgi:hypothetical protein